MPWIGLKDGQKVIPEGVDDTTVECPGCTEPMYVRSQSSDGKAKHFAHYPDQHAKSRSGGCNGGESDVHRRMKSLVVSRLKELYLPAERSFCRPEVTLGNRRADALLKFPTPDEDLGAGVIVEVQYRNESKDTKTVEHEYLQEGYSTVS